MTVTEARQLMIAYLLPSIAPFGYAEKKGNSSDLFIKKTAIGTDVVVGGFTNYNPVQRIVYSLAKKIKDVNAILLKLQSAGITIAPTVTRSTLSIGLSYSSFISLGLP